MSEAPTRFFDYKKIAKNIYKCVHVVCTYIYKIYHSIRNYRCFCWSVVGFHLFEVASANFYLNYVQPGDWPSWVLVCLLTRITFRTDWNCMERWQNKKKMMMRHSAHFFCFVVAQHDEYSQLLKMLAMLRLDFCYLFEFIFIRISYHVFHLPMRLFWLFYFLFGSSFSITSLPTKLLIYFQYVFAARKKKVSLTTY